MGWTITAGMGFHSFFLIPSLFVLPQLWNIVTICNRTNVNLLNMWYMFIFHFYIFTLTPFHFRHCISAHVHPHGQHAFYITFHSFLILRINACLPCLLHGFCLQVYTCFLLYIRYLYYACSLASLYQNRLLLEHSSTIRQYLGIKPKALF